MGTEENRQEQLKEGLMEPQCTDREGSCSQRDYKVSKTHKPLTGRSSSPSDHLEIGEL